jgi:23S rRNA (adenine2503-C2)-methyltransferase
MKISAQSPELINFLDLTPAEFYKAIQDLGQSKFRASQVLDWVYDKQVYDFSDMLNLSKDLRAQLKARFRLNLPQVKESYKSKDGSVKFLLELWDHSEIEMILMPSEKTATLCISSQVGCARKCKFCATGRLGLKRNLQTGEIVGQVLLAKKYIKDRKLTNVVFMGMGEPLDNYDNVVQTVRIFTDEKALNLSSRKITISTCGVIPKIKLLANEDIKVKLAVSLNAVIDSKRDEIMPINKIFPLSDLKKTLLDFRHKTSYKVTFEYVMIKNFNMGNDDVRALLKFLGDQSCKLNLIAWNPIEGLDYEAPNEKAIEEFKAKLSQLQCPIIQRDSRGNDIKGACGQLAGSSKN